MDEKAEITQWKKRVAGHRERLRERFLNHGLDSFTDSDVIEMLLTFGTPRQDCKERARRLLKEFGGLHEVLEAPLDELLRVKGIGPKNVVALKFVHEVARRFLKARLLERPILACARDVVDYLTHLVAFKDREVFLSIFLDSGNSILDVQELFSGTIDRTHVYPREIAKIALKIGAKNIILAHNHPSGRVSPSTQDIKTTKRIMLALAPLEIGVLDHIIIGAGGRYLSFEDQGMMAPMRSEVLGIVDG